jgi:HAD superfamily hydrolase (TIGR01490 family)
MARSVACVIVQDRPNAVQVDWLVRAYPKLQPDIAGAGEPTNPTATTNVDADVVTRQTGRDLGTVRRGTGVDMDNGGLGVPPARDGARSDPGANPDASVAPHLAELAASPSGAHIGAYFDLDGTLVSGFTATAHAGHRIRNRQARIGEVLGVLEASLRYRLGRMEFERLVVRAAGYLRGESLTELDALGEWLFRRHIEARVFAGMQQVVRAHQERGHTVVVSSSALTIHAEPVARHLGVADVICNHFEVDARGALTGGIVAPIVWGARKAAAVELFSAAKGVDLQRSYFYADGDEDVFLMRAVGNPRPVNPRSGLAAEAARAGWPVLRVSGPERRGAARALRRRA